MAVVKGISLNTINSLKDEITFVNYKSILVARKRRRKGWTNPPPNVVAWQNRMKICNLVLRELQPSVVDAYKYWSHLSDFTWKDQYTSQFLGMWRDELQMPMVVTSLTHTLIGGTLELTFTFAAQKAVDGEGYGTLPYGSSPWGSVDELYTDDGARTPLKYRFEFGPELSRPNIEFYGSPQKPGGCGFPSGRSGSSFATYNPFTPDPVQLVTKFVSRGMKFAEDGTADNCVEADVLAWNKYQADTRVGIPSFGDASIRHETHRVNGNWRGAFISLDMNMTIPLSSEIPKSIYATIDTATISFGRGLTDNLTMWNHTVEWGGLAVTVRPTQESIKIPSTQQYLAESPLTISDNTLRPHTYCPLEGDLTNTINTLSIVNLTFNPIYPNGTISTTDIPTPPFVVWLRDIDNNVPILCPPFLVT